MNREVMENLIIVGRDDVGGLTIKFSDGKEQDVQCVRTRELMRYIEKQENMGNRLRLRGKDGSTLYESPGYDL